MNTALKAGGIEALKAIFNHPAFSIPAETIKAWLEVESNRSRFGQSQEIKLLHHRIENCVKI